MNLYTIGFTQKSAEQFFGLIKENGIDIVIDVRLNNTSQLAGFAKEQDLKYFLHALCQCAYRYCAEYAPTKEIMDGFKKNHMPWDTYVVQYTHLMKERGDYTGFVAKFSSYQNICLLCSEATAERCHRRLLAEMIAEGHDEIRILHI